MDGKVALSSRPFRTTDLRNHLKDGIVQVTLMSRAAKEIIKLYAYERFRKFQDTRTLEVFVP